MLNQSHIRHVNDIMNMIYSYLCDTLTAGVASENAAHLFVVPHGLSAMTYHNSYLRSDAGGQVWVSKSIHA